MPSVHSSSGENLAAPFASADKMPTKDNMPTATRTPILSSRSARFTGPLGWHALPIYQHCCLGTTSSRDLKKALCQEWLLYHQQRWLPP